MAVTGPEQLVTAAIRRGSPLGKLRQIWAEETRAISLRNCLAQFLPRMIPTGSGGRLRARLYRALGVRVGSRSLIMGALDLGTAPGSVQRIRLGERCFVNSRVYIDAAAEVTIGNGAAIGHHVVIITTDHAMGPPHHRAGAIKFAPVTIGDGAWIAAGVTILPGVTVGAGAVVAAGAVVRRDVPPNVLAGGIPARVIRHLDAAEHPHTS